MLVTQITATGRRVEYWDRLFYGEPSLDDLNAAESVVWSFETGLNDFANPTNLATLSSTELTTMKDFLDGGGRLDAFGQLFAEQVALVYLAFPPTGTVVPDIFSTFDTFLRDRFGIDVTNGGLAVDPSSGGIEISGVPGDPIGEGIAGPLTSAFLGGRDTLSLVGPAAPTFEVVTPTAMGSSIVGDRTSYEPSATGGGRVDPGRPGRTTMETFSTADLPPGAGLTARSRILDHLEDEVSASARLSVNGSRVRVSVSASSSHGKVTDYVYDFGDGSALVTSTSSTATHRYRKGAKPGVVTVQIGDSLGHRTLTWASSGGER
jgi:hypothetical protein